MQVKDSLFNAQCIIGFVGDDFVIVDAGLHDGWSESDKDQVLHWQCMLLI